MSIPFASAVPPFPVFSMFLAGGRDPGESWSHSRFWELACEGLWVILVNVRNFSLEKCNKSYIHKKSTNPLL